MAQDAELDRLKTTQDLAFQRKQRAYDAMDTARKRRSAARDTLDRAHDAKQRAYDTQSATWEYYQSVRSSKGPRIDSLNDQQERAFQNMKTAFDNASSAHNRRDGASASSYAADGHRYKAEAQGYVAERRQLVQEIREAKERHESTRPAFQNAKAQFDNATRDHDRAKADHEQKQAEFRRAKAEFDSAVTAFKKRLEQVQSESKRKKDDKRAVAQRAGVPYQYLHNVWVSRQSDGMVNIYFGGAGKPDGPGHGHYVMDQYDRVVYRREPFDPHGAQNFVRDPQIEKRLAQIAMDAWARQQTTKRQIQYQDGSYVVKAGSGYSRDLDAITTDIIIAERSGSDEHYHLVIDDRGNIVFSGWRKNH